MRVNPLRPSSNVDLPDVVLHMTGRWGPKAAGVLPTVAAAESAWRMASILWSRQLLAQPVFGSDWPVVCFTHTTRRALAGLTSRFDGLGIAFHAQSVFNAGGAPVLYVRGDEHEALHANTSLSEAFRSRIVRWWPGATEDDPWANLMLPHSVSGPSEWTHEREWRIPRPAEVTVDWGWRFTPQDVAFVLIPSTAYGDTIYNQLEGFKSDPRNAPSDLAWLYEVPVAARVGDAWVFTRGDAPGWT